MPGLRAWERSVRHTLVHAWSSVSAPSTDGLQWLFVATLPNSGSTALAKLLQTSPHVATTEARGEGQWLVPQMCRPRDRWDPAAPLDLDLVRSVWVHEARRRTQRGDGPWVVVEKSPSNIVRMAALLETFAGTDPRLVVFTRHPLAVCASWAQRKTPEQVVSSWLPEGTPVPADDEEFLALLGRVCGERMQLLAEMRALSPAPLVTSYEELTDATEEFVHRLTTLVPALGAVDTGADLTSIKDYPAQGLRNMNEEQVDRLPAHRREALQRALAPWHSTFATFGYAL